MPSVCICNISVLLLISLTEQLNDLLPRGLVWVGEAAGILHSVVCQLLEILHLGTQLLRSKSLRVQYLPWMWSIMIIWIIWSIPKSLSIATNLMRFHGALLDVWWDAQLFVHLLDCLKHLELRQLWNCCCIKKQLHHDHLGRSSYWDVRILRSASLPL